MPPIRQSKRIASRSQPAGGEPSSLVKPATIKPEPVQTHPLQPGPLTEEIAAGATPVMADTESATEHVPIPLQRKPNAFTSRKPVKGDVEVKFRNDSAWDRNLDFIGPGHSLGTQTKKLSFGDGFVLTDNHIDDLTGLGPLVCKNLTHFLFEYDDVSYSAHNHCLLSDTGVEALAAACPNLTRVELPGIKVNSSGSSTAGSADLSGDALAALFKHCPKLTFLEMTPASRSGGLARSFSAALDALRLSASWAPKLKTLRIGSEWCDMNSMRELGKARPAMTIELVSVSEEKKWGDWELVKSWTKYKNGRKMSGDNATGYESASVAESIGKVNRMFARYDGRGLGRGGGRARGSRGGVRGRGRGRHWPY